MHATGRFTLSKFRLVYHAIAAKVQGTITWVLDGISNTPSDGSGSNPVVHENAGCEYSDYHRRGILPRGDRCGWANRCRVIGPVEIDNPSCEPNGPWASITIQTSGRKAGKLSKDIAGNRRKGGRRVHRSAAQHSPERQALPMAINGICEFPHAYFPNGNFECIGGGCGTGNWKKVVRKTRGMDKRITKGAI